MKSDDPIQPGQLNWQRIGWCIGPGLNPALLGQIYYFMELIPASDIEHNNNNINPVESALTKYSL